jgi:hypothetical protein
MNKFYAIILLLLANVAAMAQLQNASFENWTSHSYDDPTGFMTGNQKSPHNGLIPITRVSGHSGYGVRIETMISNAGDTSDSYIANGDPMQGTGGIPISGIPTAFTGFYRYSLANNDSAIILLVFKSNGNIINQTVQKIHGTGTQNTFTAFSFPVSLGQTPDSVVIAAASSNLIDNVGVEIGSFLELDGIGWTGVNSPIPNSEFENWTTNTSFTLGSWESYGDGFSRTTDSHDGTYAASMRTIDYGNGDISSSGITNGQQTQNGPVVGGVPFNQQIDTVIFWYKYSTQCSDSAMASAQTSVNGNNSGGNMQRLPAASQWTYFQLPIWSNQTPDMIHIDFSSSIWPYTNSCDGSTLIVDQIGMMSALIANIPNYHDRKSLFAYPNPSVTTVHINSGNNFNEETLVEVFDISGRVVMTENKKVNSDDAINISILQSGRYYCRQTSSRGDSMTSFIKQ